MRIISAGFEILNPFEDYMCLKQYLESQQKFIEKVGRTCYKSEDKITDISSEKFVRMLIDNGHDAMIEHSVLSVKFIVDRGISHEIVRHREASYAQESTRYCNYIKDKFGSEITVIEPPLGSNFNLALWCGACEDAETRYFDLISRDIPAQLARDVLPNSLKTEVIVTTNFREWRHFFKLRTAKAAHPQMREVAIPLLKKLQEYLPVVFGDIEVDTEV